MTRCVVGDGRRKGGTVVSLHIALILMMYGVVLGCEYVGVERLSYEVTMEKARYTSLDMYFTGWNLILAGQSVFRKITMRPDPF